MSHCTCIVFQTSIVQKQHMNVKENLSHACICMIFHCMRSVCSKYSTFNIFSVLFIALHDSLTSVWKQLKTQKDTQKFGGSFEANPQHIIFGWKFYTILYLYIHFLYYLKFLDQEKFSKNFSSSQWIWRQILIENAEYVQQTYWTWHVVSTFLARLVHLWTKRCWGTFT